MKPEEYAQQIIDGQGEDLSRYQRMFLKQDIASVIREAVAEAYNDAAATCEEWASEHTSNDHGKRELEGVAKLLRARATGEEIR